MTVLERIARPVLEAAGERRLEATMPLELSEGGVPRPRGAAGRLLSGIAPWPELRGLLPDTPPPGQFGRTTSAPLASPRWG